MQQDSASDLGEPGKGKDGTTGAVSPIEKNWGNMRSKPNFDDNFNEMKYEAVLYVLISN
jgi:hypothetical protein